MVIVALSILLLVVTMRPLLGWQLAALAVLGFMPTWETFRMGQVNAMVALLTALAIAYAYAERAGRAAAALTAGVLLKITPALGLAALALRAPRRTIAGSAVVAGVAFALTVPFVGIEAWARGLVIAMQADRSTHGMASIGPLLTNLPGAAGRFAPVALALTLTLLTLARGRHLPTSDALAALALIPIVAAPIVWTHHLVMALPALAVLWKHGGRAAWLAGMAWLAGAFIAMQFATALLLPVCWIALCWPAVLGVRWAKATASHNAPPLA